MPIPLLCKLKLFRCLMVGYNTYLIKICVKVLPKNSKFT